MQQHCAARVPATLCKSGLETPSGCVARHLGKALTRHSIRCMQWQANIMHATQRQRTQPSDKQAHPPCTSSQHTYRQHNVLSHRAGSTCMIMPTICRQCAACNAFRRLPVAGRCTRSCQTQQQQQLRLPLLLLPPQIRPVKRMQHKPSCSCQQTSSSIGSVAPFNCYIAAQIQSTTYLNSPPPQLSQTHNNQAGLSENHTGNHT